MTLYFYYDKINGYSVIFTVVRLSVLRRLQSAARRRELESMDTLNTVIRVLTTIVTVCTAYQIFYLLVGFFSPKIKFSPAKKKHRYAVVVTARNEENVIAKLIESIHNQT